MEERVAAAAVNVFTRTERNAKTNDDRVAWYAVSAGGGGVRVGLRVCAARGVKNRGQRAERDRE